MFEPVWNNPTRSVEKMEQVGSALSPDFSIYRNMPPVMQQWNVYRNRWMGAWWAYNNITVITTVGWAERSSYDFCFLGAPRKSVVAISPVGVNDKQGLELFNDGIVEMCDRLEPTLILSYGSVERLKLPSGLPPIKCYNNRWEARKATQ